MLGSNLSAWQDSIKRCSRIWAHLAAHFLYSFYLLENKSNKSWGLGQSPKVNLICIFCVFTMMQFI
ncbi:MAG TPA: hypothetical protein PK033_14550 [Acetivibrio sp.]|nr:hypothetical protein [Acetivibrio sp.]